MVLDPGTNLGPYMIESPLGAGGMGEVYKTRDTRLDRTVAIKVLPEHVANDLDLRQRFEREAKTISSLNHPHICTLYDIGKEGATDFLVMEYLDGQTLAQRLEKGPLPMRPGTDHCYRDRGCVGQGAPATDRPSGSEAGQHHADQGGGEAPGLRVGEVEASRSRRWVVGDRDAKRGTDRRRQDPLGTLPYMAPEQLEGKDVDARTDIFAFGATIYEMVTGEKAFTGDSQASLIGAILKDEPQLVSALEPTTPTTPDYVVKTCLAKDPDDRWQSAGDIGRQMRGIVESGSVASGAVPVVAAIERGSWRRALTP